MSYRDNCGICGESYDSDNLATCRACNREFCYRCGDFGESLCKRCIAERPAAGDSELRRHRP